MTINELIQVAHADAKAKGWWDEPRNTGELLMLIVSECGEALEAHRNGRMGDLQQFDARYPERNCELSEEASLSLFRNAFEDYIKDSFSDELADIVIRIADRMGAAGWLFNESSRHHFTMKVSDNTGECLYMVSRWVIDDQASLSEAMARVFAIAHQHNIDIWRHIELKLAYNRTRSYRHGKAY